MIRMPGKISRLLELLKEYRAALILAVIGMAVTAATESAMAALMKPLLDQGFSDTKRFALWMVPIFLIGIFLARGSSTFLTNYMMSYVTAGFLNKLRALMFDRALHLPIDFYEKFNPGRVINSMMFEVQQVIDMIRNVITSLIRDTLTVLGLLGYLLYLNWALTLIVLALMPILTFVVRVTGKRMRILNKESLVVNGELTQILDETTRAQQVIKIFGGQNYEKLRFEVHAEKLRRFTMKMTVASSITVPLTQIFTASAISIVVMIALAQAHHNQTTVGSFMSFIAAALLLLTPLKRLADLNGPLQRGLAAADSVFEIIDATPERQNGIVLLDRAKGKIQFQDFSFSYATQNGAALRNINLTIAKGETLALVGMSGGGKTTLISMLPGFYPDYEGQILLDDISLKELNLASLRQQIAMVSQHVILFDDTLETNIAYGDATPDRKRIEAAVRGAYLSEIVSGLPHGLNTRIGENGSQLSGGQRQRVAIARAIYKDAPILILDEATSALDTESERTVQLSLETLMRGRTTLVIAHRLSTIEKANRIVVLEHGRIVEVGNHQKLLAKNGVYANLYKLQFAEDAS